MGCFIVLLHLPDVLLGDTVSQVKKGSLIVIPPHCVHQLFNQKLTVYERYIVTISTKWLSEVFIESGNLMCYAYSSNEPMIIQLSQYKETILRYSLEVNMKSVSDQNISGFATFFSVLELIDSLIVDGINKDSAKVRMISPSQKRINEIIAFINNHISEPLDLLTIADSFNINKDYLGRVFKEHTHSSIGHYISVQRASLAQTMLSDGMTVSEVQEKLGFSSYAYFFKFFKKMTGISPSQFRKKDNHRENFSF